MVALEQISGIKTNKVNANSKIKLYKLFIDKSLQASSSIL